MTTEPVDLSAYRAVRRGVEQEVHQQYPGQLESLSERERRHYLHKETLRIQDLLRAHRRSER